ncbi:hypothetical protein CERSUDRAFT_117283 [Gelatoporia subvermispora B]|uniref:Uncharacterized protein n=1 Tax=Ceriporiopsis subvermispora (strain B) TaxID=914234 RepID=M2R7M5_CERS8|nr:hypothetical protein CERSUDRAFT_117283 [Gelatoporia subvermispora B]
MAASSPVMSMAPPSIAAADAPQRPSMMRRKSSAQNLLSSFKAPAPPPAGAPQPQPATTTSAASTPTHTSMPREWDVQSLQSDAAPPAVPNGAAVQGTSVEILRELVRKRIITLTYMRNVHEGRSHWFHTIMVTRAELDRAFPNSAMKNRTYKFAMLGMALAHLFDVKEPQDLLRGLSNALNEYEMFKEDGEKSRMRIFKKQIPKKQAGATDYALSYSDASDTPYMSMPHVPFALDYHQTLLSLLDVLSEVYNKISRILGPSGFPAAGNHMTGPLGLLSPHPGVSYLFSGMDTPTHEGEGSLWGIANANGGAFTGALGSPPPSWNVALGDMVRQIDQKLKKLIATLLKELDDCARAGIKDELGSLDPLLRHVSVAEDAREQYEFE